MDIKFVRGNPTPEEVAALVTLLFVAGTPRPGSPYRPFSAWASQRSLLRTSHTYGLVGWPASALPQ